MSKFSLKLKELRIAKSLSQQQLGNMVNMSKSSINMYERGEREPGIETLEAFADCFNVDLDYLLGKSDIPNRILNDAQNNIPKYDNISPIKTHRLPLLGEIACGEPIFCDEDRESYVEVGAEIHADFCLKAKGDSMINARILDGDIVLIRRQSTVDNGEIAAVVIDDEATLKRVYYDKENNQIQLCPENPKCRTFFFSGADLDRIHILGKAIGFESNL